jgi:diguanylate cyclase (GGDEF)-like protein/PAS domain S-box-containing protein
MSNAKILIVEDEIIVAKDIENKLKKLGYTVPALAYSGEEAIEKAATANLDLILMDIRLRGNIDGVEAARQIYNSFSIPIIFLTANADNSTFERAKTTNPLGYLLKPFKERELHNTIEITLSRYKIEKKLKDNEQWLATILKSIGDGVIACDRNKAITFMNPIAETLTEWQEQEAVGKSATEVFNITHEETRTLINHPITEALELGVVVGIPEKTILITKNGTEIPIDDSAAPIKDDKGNIKGAVWVFRDITERKISQAMLYRRQQEFRALVEHAPDIIARFNAQLRYVYVNPAIENLMEIPAPRFIGKTNAELNMPEDVCWLWEQKLRQVFQSKQENEFEFGFPTASGAKYYHARLVPELASNGSVESVLSIARDITALKLAEAKLIHDASHDALTGLPNRALFMDRLERAIAHTKRRANYIFALLFLDLDRFKAIDDGLGHTLGDRLLVAFARRLETLLRDGDTIARLGGDEFTILLDDIADASDVSLVANRIQKALQSPFNLGEHEVFVTASIGIALNASDYTQAEELLRDADIAMYRAKALGKARYEIFDSAMYTQATKLMRLEMDLRRAIERQELLIHYQPIVSLSTGKIIGFEALVRWQHSQHGLVSPAQFIPVAEETGSIVPIGYWVLREACRQMRVWQEQFPTAPLLTISVNLSSKQFSQPDLIEQIARILQETGLDASCLKLEITESALMENTQSANSMLLRLREMNIQLHLDDFGTGYSSLSYLHRFPSSALKIDRSFVSQIGFEGENMEIVRAIVTLAHSLNIDTVAEGVETVEQLAQLRSLKCKYAQGYYCSRPLDSQSIEALIARGLSILNTKARSPRE